MKIKRAVLFAVLAIAVAALTVPLLGLNARAAGSAKAAAPVAAAPSARPVSRPSGLMEVTQDVAPVAEQGQGADSGKISPATLEALGIKRIAKNKLGEMATRGAQQIASSVSAHITPLPAGGRFNAPAGAGHTTPALPSVGQPQVLNVNDALSAALMTNVGGRDNQFSEVTLIADWDGREDCTAERGSKIDDFSTVEPDIDFTLTKTAISEHTRGNGHPFFNVYYYGDSIGNVYMGVDLVGNSLVDIVFAINFPSLVNTGASNGFTLLNPTAGDCMDDQVTVTGLAVNPVADLGDFDPALCGVTGEVVYVMTLDSEGCASNAANQPIRSRIFAFGLTEGSDAGGGSITFTNVRQILRSRFANSAGLAVDDDGSLYYHLIDLIQFTGGAIFKATELCRTVANCGGANPRINRFIPSIPDPPSLNSWVGTAANPIVTANGVRNTNYGGGLSTTFGNLVSLATGAGNVLYAAVARSFVAGADSLEQRTEGLFPAPGIFPAGLPSMVISFAACSGAFDTCSGITVGAVTTNVGGIIPVGNGIADVQPVTAGTIPALTPGVNNFRLFVQGDGPDVTGRVVANAAISGATATNTIAPIAGFQVDFSTHSGLVVSEEGTVFVISGGAPAGPGKNPSPMLGEILCFEDMCPMDRRADFVDLRGNAVPNPPASGGNVGDGDSDRFDHIFYQAPLDQVTFTPAGLSGLARGFLRYTNRLAPNGFTGLSGDTGLGVTKAVQGDDDTDGTIIFERLDPGHQVAGGDDQNSPNRGDDSAGGGTPLLSLGGL